MKSNMKHVLLILIILAIFISGCKEPEDKSSKGGQFDPPPGCHYEVEYLGPAPNSNLTDSDAGSIFVVIMVCD